MLIELRGTPNSTTTSMSELSTVAIKDGHRGHFQHHHQPLDAERADRISRLAGLERVGVARNIPGLAPSSANVPPPGYFDSNNNPTLARERSTVGSASATGSVGGRTTWASGSDAYDPDRMSEDQEVENSSTGGFSDEAASLVGTGEGAMTPARQNSQYGSPAMTKASAVPSHLKDQQQQGSPASTSSRGTATTTSSTRQQKQDARAMDGMTYDQDVLDTAARTPPLTGQRTGENMTTEQTVREQLHQRHLDSEGRRTDSMDVDKTN
ncbi:hypothetical protein M011DRAFT_13866 [Sporormia fimetaria CBS 119925]|uniref:Uncharacterized protein n=1 Tax=Sporormia fimetaria CBS 119925 TaxID=1340428 RepID=A0A6A6VQ80_9PLEO|nr:hypothetical protein M011DRAFT_13866 [Sporormia fimetaria CBS 119925]